MTAGPLDPGTGAQVAPGVAPAPDADPAARHPGGEGHHPRPEPGQLLAGNLAGRPFHTGQLDHLTQLQQVAQLFERDPRDEVAGPRPDGDEVFLAEHLQRIADRCHAGAIMRSQLIDSQALAGQAMPVDDRAAKLRVDFVLGRRVLLQGEQPFPGSSTAN